MLHESLFHLLDCNNKALLNLLDSEEFLHHGDQEILYNIVAIGAEYRNLQDYYLQISRKCCVCKQAKSAEIDNCLTGIRPGLYLTAFCDGLDEVLQEYREEVFHLEDLIMQNPQLLMSYVLSKAERYVALFSLLKSMLSMINMEKVHGCLLVGWLYSYNNYGIDFVVSTSNKIQSFVNVIFYKQLANWLICGDLVDEYDEFFIEPSPDWDRCTHSITSASSEQDNDQQVRSQTGSNPPPHGSSAWRFRLRLENLPDVIALETAEDILFTGQMVWIVREQDSNNDVWQDRSLTVMKRIQSLEQKSFNLNTFNETIAYCKSEVSHYLWPIILDETDGLRHHLRLLRDYYCLGRGELFQQYVVVAQDLTLDAGISDVYNCGGGGGGRSIGVTSRQGPSVIGAGPSSSESRQRHKRLDGLFHEMARKLYGDLDRSHERFTMNENEMLFQASWPLDVLVFNQHTVRQYNRLFQFLLRIQRTQTHLHQLWWFQHKQPKSYKLRSTTSTTSGSSGALSTTWSLRHNLQFVIDNIQYYLHVDVIESQFAQFEHSLDKAISTSDVTSLHSKFLSRLLSRTFVMGSVHSENADSVSSDRMVYNILCLLLDLCNEFCGEVTIFNGSLDQPSLDQFEQRFQTMIEMLLRVLYSLHEKVSSGYHLLQLLHRLDFNRWYSKSLSGSDLNLTKLQI